MRKIIILTIILVLAVPAATRANDIQQLTEKQKVGIQAAARWSFPKQQTLFYRNRVFVKDANGFLVTFKVLPTERKLEGIAVRSGWENDAFIFLLRVDDFIHDPTRGLFGFGLVVDDKKIGNQNPKGEQ